MRVVGFLVSVLIAAVTAPAASAEPRWFEPIDISSGGASDLRVAAGGGGDQVVTWLRSFDGRTVVQAASRSRGQAFSPPADVSIPAPDRFVPELGITAFATSSPDAAVNRAGDAIVVWERFDGSSTIVQAATREAGGRFGAPVDVSAPGQNAATPRAGIDDAGNAVVTWHRGDGRTQIVQAATRSRSGRFDVPVDLSAPGRDALSPEVAVNPSGDALVVWVRRDDGQHPVVQTALRPAGGTFSAAVSLSPQDRFALAPHPALAATGEAVVVWTELSTFDDRTAVARAAARTPGGSFGPAGDLTAPELDAFGVDVGIDARGTATAVWSARPEGGSTVRVQSATRSAGEAFAPPVDLAADATAGASQVAVAPTGETLAAWRVEIAGRGVVRAAQRPADGGFGVQRDLSDLREGAGSPRVALDGPDRAIAVFLRGDGATRVQAALFDEDRPPEVAAVLDLRVAPTRLRAARSGPAVRPASAAGGTKVGYRLTSASSVRFTVRRGGRRVGRFTRVRPAGRDRFTFTGRLGGRSLRPGRYRLVAAPAGGESASTAFRVTR